jgi:hypothetical protein
LVTPICGAGGTLAVALHGGSVLPGVHTPPGGFAVAVLLTEAGGLAVTVAVTVYSTELPGGKVVMTSLIVPLPLAVHVAPPLAAQTQVCEAMPAGTGSLTGVPFAGTEPVFVTVIV